MVAQSLFKHRMCAGINHSRPAAQEKYDAWLESEGITVESLQDGHPMKRTSPYSGQLLHELMDLQ